MKSLITILVLLFIATTAAAAPDSFAESANQLVQLSKINKINTAVTASYTKANMKGNAIIDDSTFVRRAYLTLAGRIPTLTEYDAFIKSNAADKRMQLTRYLTRSAAFTSNMYNVWADQLRLRERINNTNNVNGALYIDYVKKQIFNNVPYDKFVYSLLTAQGSYYDVPAAGYMLRDLGMPLDNLIATSRVFMGIDIGCAQCHDDPFQSWTQMQFYQFAAMFSSAEANRRTMDPAETAATKRIRLQVDEMIKADPAKRGLNNQVNNFTGALFAGITVKPNSTLKLPHDYHYKDGEPNQVVKPKVLFGKDRISSKAEDLRSEAALWITNRDHPTFTKNIVNRLWQLVMGQAIIDDVDNIYGSDKLNDPLLVALEQVMKDVNYSVRDFLFIVCNTEAFNRAAYDGPYAGDKYVFIGPRMVRLTAEQLWDSMLSFVVPEPEYFTSGFSAGYKQAMKVDNLVEATVPTIQQHIAMLATANKDKYANAIKHGNYLLVRASELNDAGGSVTVLQQLGRSDRELIATSSREGSVTQVISLVNGAMADIATSNTTALYKAIDRASPTDKVDIAFRSILARRATIAEKASFSSVDDQSLIWTLLNTNEYKFTR